MPKGVEHHAIFWSRQVPRVRNAVMPKGVEHIFDAVSLRAFRVRNAVMPKGVEHLPEYDVVDHSCGGEERSDAERR